jgi:hypothetical protein
MHSMTPAPTTHQENGNHDHGPVARLMREGLIGLCQAAELPGTFRDGRPTHPATLTRWIQNGIRLPEGTRLKLEAVRVNGRWATSRAAVVRFLERQQPGHVEPTPALRTPTRREREIEKATADLRRMGVGI